MNIAFPFVIGPDGRTRSVDRSEYIRDMIEVTLLTEPGERVNRPDFGCGVQRLVFSDPGAAMTTATVEVIRASLQHSLRELIDVHDVEIHVESSMLTIDITFTDRATTSTQSTRITTRLQ